MDTSVWVDHLRSGSVLLRRALERGQVLGHPWVTGEISLGQLGQREEIVGLLDGLPQATVATDGEVRVVIERHGLVGAGVGYVDAQLLTATMLTPDSALWSIDRRLLAAASRLGRAFEPGE